MNQFLAFVLLALFLVYIAVEMGWGGGGSDFNRYRRPRDPLWPRWRWRPPDPRDQGGPRVDAPRPRAPERIDG